MDDRKAISGLFYVARTGCQWKAIPHPLGRKSTVHDRFQEWRKAGVFEEMWRRSLLDYDATKGIDWERQSMDAAMTKAPSGGRSTGSNPTDRAKSGTKRSMLVDWNDIPMGLSVSGANRHDIKLAEPTLESIPIERPEPTPREPQNMCLDKGYDFPEIDELVKEWAYTGHIVRRGVDESKRKRIPG